jgi:Lectin C-type domain/Putative metal-binding motif
MTTACAGGDGVSGSGLASGVGSAAQTSSGAESSGTQGTAASATASSNEDVGSTSPDSSDAETGPCEPTAWYLDGDGDGRGDPAVMLSACEPPPQYVPFGDDCDDMDPARHVGADEICDGLDNDCDDAIDEASATNASCNGCSLFAIPPRSYGFCPAGATWDAARVQCGSFGGDLLRLDDEAESTAVAQLPEPPSMLGGGWFIGLSDAAARGTFQWVDGGELSFAAWLPGEPNDAGADEDCAEMEQGAGGWNDVPCSMTRPFVCESGGS